MKTINNEYGTDSYRSARKEMDREILQAALEKQGRAIHKILNETLYRKLTVREYKKLVKEIGAVFYLPNL